MIEQLWQEHLDAPFPKNLYGEVSGIYLDLQDTYIAGCVCSFVKNEGKLDLWRTAILGLCYRDVACVLPQLEGEGRAYFERLEKLASLVLQAVRDEAADEAP